MAFYVKSIFADSNPCFTSKCENQAKCVPVTEYEYICECNPYWTGRFCNIPTYNNYCYSMPCKQNSTCLLDIKYKTYSCICQPGFTGPSCDRYIDMVH